MGSGKLTGLVVIAVVMVIFTTLITGVENGIFGVTNPDTLGNLSSSTAFFAILSAIGLLSGVAGVVLTFYPRQINTAPFFAAFASVGLTALVGQITAIMNIVNYSWARWIIYPFLAAFSVAYIIAILDWIRGTD